MISATYTPGRPAEGIRQAGLETDTVKERGWRAFPGAIKFFTWQLHRKK